MTEDIVLCGTRKRGALPARNRKVSAMSDGVQADTAAAVSALYRYPVKGLTAEALPRVTLEAGGTMPMDRAYAIENGPGPFDPAHPAHLPKIHFIMLMRNEQAASLKATFDDRTHNLTIARDGEMLASGRLRDADGRAAIETAIQELFGPGLRGRPRIVQADGHSFSDVADKCLHVINLASVRALQSALGAPIHPLRFRPNLIIDGWPAWHEFKIMGQAIAAGGVTLEVFKRTERCAATNVDPATAIRDLKIPSFLSRTFGHTDFGVYARVASGGNLAVGDAVAASGRPLI